MWLKAYEQYRSKPQTKTPNKTKNTDGCHLSKHKETSINTNINILILILNDQICIVLWLLWFENIWQTK